MEKKALLVLGSSSPRRLDLLKTVGITPDIVQAPDIDETERRGELPKALVMRLSKEKNEALHALHKGKIILTADTVVVASRFILPKAETREDFLTCMKYLSGRRHRVMTSVTICDMIGKMRHKLVTSIVKVKRLSSKEIDSFYHTDEWKGKAGGYALQGYFGQFIEFMSGSSSSIIGLPICETVKMLESAGYNKD